MYPTGIHWRYRRGGRSSGGWVRMRRLVWWSSIYQRPMKYGGSFPCCRPDGPTSMSFAGQVRTAAEERTKYKGEATGKKRVSALCTCRLWRFFGRGCFTGPGYRCKQTENKRELVSVRHQVRSTTHGPQAFFQGAVAQGTLLRHPPLLMERGLFKIF